MKKNLTNENMMRILRTTNLTKGGCRNENSYAEQFYDDAMHRLWSVGKALSAPNSIPKAVMVHAMIAFLFFQFLPGGNQNV
ncbi:MAG: hypothetical protein IKD01_03890 [Oscillospiraceae bacterium]|jgi:hypothetical protein|nr:hypothetical protein [Oscillospiraceae bacterium]